MNHGTRTVFDSATVRVVDFRCTCHDTAAGSEERSDTHSIAFPRTGLFVKHVGRRPIVGDPNQVLFFNAGAPYRVSHPAGGGDTCTVLEFTSNAVLELLNELDPSSKDRPGRPFSVEACATDSRIHWDQRAAASRLSRSGSVGGVDPLAMEESLLSLAYRAVRAAYAFHGTAVCRRRADTSRAYRALADDVKVVLSRCHSEKLDLVRIARRVHSSPFHLSRVFRSETGIPIHRYLNRLRLRSCLERLTEGCGDLTALALEAGFHSHSHFTEAFGKEFGTSPSLARRALARGDAV